MIIINKADILKELRPNETLVLIKSIGLRKKYEQVLIMRYVHDMSCTDIADQLNIEVQSVRNRVCKARNLFDKYMED